MNSIFLIILSLTISNIIHMVVVKKEWLSALNIPVWEWAFGANKTLRGFLVLPVLNGIMMLLLGLVMVQMSLAPLFMQGAMFGLMYMLAELPNSFIKRRLGIAPGQRPEKNAWFFGLIDKTDSALGVSLLAMLMYQLPLRDSLLLLIISVGVHISFSGLLYSIKLKKSF